MSRLEGTLAAVVQRAGGHVTCRPGCTECCLGPFDITLLDAFRLQRGLARLAERQPEVAAAVAARARAQWAEMAAAFAGDPASGRLSDDEAARRRFFAVFQALPCPALAPVGGVCELYDSRPVSCRTFGLPVRCGDQLLPPCRLNFTAATGEEVASAAVDPDPNDEEGELLRGFWGEAGETIVAWALATALE